MLAACLLLLACTTKGGGAAPGTGITSTGGSLGTGGSSGTDGTTPTDADGDGFFASPAGDDCDDSDSEVYPGATEICGDGVDQDCDGAEAGCTGSLMSTQGGGYLKGGGQVYGLGRDAAVLHGWRADGGTTLALSAPWWEVDYYDNSGAVFFVHPEDMQGAAVVDTRASGMVFESDLDQILGWAISAGDVDGDGIDDVLMGEPQASFLPDFSGGSRLVYGPVSIVTSAADVSTVHIGGVQSYQAVGYLTQLATNLAGDDRLDMVLGWPQGCWEGQPDKVGGAYIVPNDGIVTRDIDTDDIEVLGEAPCIGTLADMVVGDLNGDGFDDLIGSAHFGGKPQSKGTKGSKGDDELGPGRVYVVLGPITASMNLADADVRLDGVQNNSLFGDSLAVTPDQTGDGRADLLVGAKWQNGEVGTYGGAAWLISGEDIVGDTVGDTVTDAVVSDVATVHFSASEAGMQFGNGVSDGGDQDGDGHREVLVSAESSKSNGYRGQVFVFAGPLSGTLSSEDAILEVYGRSDDDALGAGFNGTGAALLGGADFNADGYDDWLVGASLPSDDFIGAVYTFYGGVWP